ncbi:hypothetical protein ACQP1V_43100 (plasmid) [Microtetraspora malaysiensis]|uniref:hypothetical protein n=1 Tax=Microtetraspora malaysiensis TaxID=161358 RepID=UPI003D920499
MIRWERRAWLIASVGWAATAIALFVSPDNKGAMAWDNVALLVLWTCTVPLPITAYLLVGHHRQRRDKKLVAELGRRHAQTMEDLERHLIDSLKC